MSQLTQKYILYWSGPIFMLWKGKILQNSALGEVFSHFTSFFSIYLAPDRKIPLETFDYHIKIHKFAEFHGAMAIFEGAGVKKPNRIQKPSDL